MRYLKLYEYFMFNNMELSYDFEKVFRKRFVEKKFEDDDFLNIKEILERDCKKFLDELKSKNQKPRFRRTKIDKKIQNSIYRKW